MKVSEYKRMKRFYELEFFWSIFFEQEHSEHNDQSAFRNSGPKRPFPLRDFAKKKTRKLHQTSKVRLEKKTRGEGKNAFNNSIHTVR